jgi:hypothetical protein
VTFERQNTENKMMKSKAIYFYFIAIFTICLSCKNDNSVKEKELQAKVSALELSEKELIIKANKAEKALIHNLPQIIDDPKLENQKIVIYAEKYNDSLIFSKNELNKIEILFPLFKSEFISNPNEAYTGSGEWKDYIDQEGKKEHYSFGSEVGQDNFCLVYAYYLKQRNGEKKYKTERKNLIELYRAINGLYDGLNCGGTFYGHQHKRLNAFAEYSIYLLTIEKDYFEKKYDFRKQKELYIKSFIQYVADEESQNVYYQMDLVENKPKAIERAKKLKAKIDILEKLITNYFYLNQVQDFEKNY